MAGFRILYVPPRRIGPITTWSGLNAPDGNSWLLKRAADLGFNAIWFSPMHETSQIEKNAHGRTMSGSLYAIRNHFSMDPEFSTGSDSEDIRHYKHFTKTAKKKGITVFADLVFNHVAADHPLVKKEEALLAKIQSDGPWTVITGGAGGREPIGISYTEDGVSKTYHFLFRHDLDGDGRGREWLQRRICGPMDDPWSDVAQINYDSPAARDFFLTGKDAYWKKQLDWYMDKVGITAFRCDVAYMIAPDAWQELISYARAKNPDAFFMAETLGAPDDKAAGLGKARITDKKGSNRPAFDLGMVANYWWNFVDRWLPDHENPRLNKMAKFGGAASPDSHDTASTVAGHFMEVFNNRANRDQIVAAISVRNYAVSVFLGNSVYMQMGYELCSQKQNSVFKGSDPHKDWQNLVATRGQDHALNISKQVRRINDIKKRLGVENCQAEFRDIRELADGKIIQMHISYRDPDQEGKVQKEVILFINRRVEDGAVRLDETALRGFTEKGFVAEGANPMIEDVMILHTPTDRDKKLQMNRTGLPKNGQNKI